jgi:hypothetical protein
LAGEDLITVRFTVPVEGVDPDTGERFLADRHRVRTQLMRQDATETQFLNGVGAIVARWRTQLIESVEWPQPAVPAPEPTPGVANDEWRRPVQRRGARAYAGWSDDEVERLTAEFRAGLSVAELARRHRRERGAITSRLKDLGLTDPDVFDARVGRSGMEHEREREGEPDTESEPS